MTRFVITGTNTDIGKTVFAAGLTQALDGCYWKPIQAGLDDGTDAQRVASLTGLSPDGILPETVERTDHPWFIGVQYHPELKSRPFAPHPLFASFIEAALVQSRLV